jgi:hypothetical protein
MNELTHQDSQDLVDIWSDLNNQLIEQVNLGEKPIQVRINENHKRRIEAFRTWLTHHQGKTIKG